MSDTTDTTAAVDPTPVEADSGQVEADSGATPEPEAPILDTNEFADHHVVVKVDGNDVKVPLSEVTAGYQRQSDYTRKTQELAEQRQQLQWANAIAQALDNNPNETIKLLQQHYGVSAAEAQKIADNAVEQSEGSDGWVDPVEARVKELDSRIRQFEEEREYQRLEREVQRLQSTYGDDFDPQEVIGQALAMNNSDLEAVFKQMAFDKVRARVQATEQYSEQKAAEEAAIVEAKRNGGVVAGGTSAAGETAVDSGPIRTVSDAWEAAKRQYGIT